MKIIQTKISQPPRIVLYGVHGVGKSTFAADCPSPIFIQTERGLDALEVDAFELATEWGDLHKAVDFLANNEHPYKTLAIDSLDWAEKLAFDKVCKEANVKAIGDIPFGRGYSQAEKLWREFLEALSYLNTHKKMLIVAIAHSQIKRFEDPEREGYDRYQLDLQAKAAALVAEWCDILGFATFDKTIKTKDGKFGQQITKASSSGDRILYLEERPAYDAKNRYGLPHELPLAWDAVAAAIKEKRASRAKKPNLESVRADKQAADLEKLTE
jgi:hypothetical protein